MTSAREEFAQVAVVLPFDAALEHPLDEPVHGLVLHYRGGQHGGTIDPNYVEQAAEDIWRAMLTSISPCEICPTIDWTRRGVAEFVVQPFTIT